VNQITRARLFGPAHRRDRGRPAQHPGWLAREVTGSLGQAILDAYDRGASLAEIAAATGLAVPAVHRVVILRSARR
jgi:1,6-anhydro-N-acetylmuramate kinase